ncbi:MAG: amidohydrolase family protein [Planctomycetota bacterium]|jgi:N-acetylglucosamine-6-phosphate deacetylase|nr:amidohydrolase family protein [Planctomycetota bacterium]
MKKGIQAQLWDGKQFRAGWLSFSRGTIDSVSFRRPTAKRAASLHDLSEVKLLPGFVDTLLHGYAGVDCGDGTPARLNRMTIELAKAGVTTALAGFYPLSIDGFQRAAKNWNKWQQLKGRRAHIAGWHVEGPFISKVMSGALPKSKILKPSAAAAQKFVDACGGWLRVSTIAPEVDGALEACEVLRSNQVLPSIGHSQATYLDCEMLAANGKIAATHLGNRMLPLSARELGPIGMAMNGGIDYVAVIPDQIHVAAETLGLWASTTKMKSRLIACSDNLSHAGKRAASFVSGGKKLQRSGCVAVDAAGNLGGTLDALPQLLLRAYRDGVLTLEQVVRMGCHNPGDMLGDCGRFEVGRRADFVEFKVSENSIGQVWCRGKKL